MWTNPGGFEQDRRDFAGRFTPGEPEIRRHEIKDEDWERIKDMLLGQPGDPDVTAKDNRSFLNAVLWIARTGAPLARPPRTIRPVGYGLEAIRSLIQERGVASGLRGATRPRPGVGNHRQLRGPGPPACGRGRKKGVDDDEALGRSRGGFSTKIHIAVDGLGNPIEFRLTGGQVGDVAQAEPLIGAHETDAYILDKAYDSDTVVQAAQRQGGEAVIPPKKNRKVPREYDKHLYRKRKKIE